MERHVKKAGDDAEGRNGSGTSLEEPLDGVLNKCYPIPVMRQHALTARPLADLPIFRAASMQKAAGGGTWRFDNLVGVLAEISEEAPSGAVSFAAEIIAEAQARSEPVAWVAGTDSVFFPPDLLARGIDLSAVAVVRAGGEAESLTAAEWLVRSGALGLVIVDCGAGWDVSDASLGRILKLAELRRCAVLFLTRKRRHDPSLGSRISLRGCVTRSAAGAFSVEIHTVKDKRSNSVSRQGRHYHGPPGMY